MPRTPDGHPDFSGVWTNKNITPFERPRELAGKEFFTPQEVTSAGAGAAATNPGASWKTMGSPDRPLMERCLSFNNAAPMVHTKPWTEEIPFVKSDGLLYEYACHEGNEGMRGILSAARSDEKKAKAAKP